MWECSVSKIISRLLSFLFKCLFQKSYHCLPLKDENMGNYYAKSIIYLTKLSKTFWYNPRGKVFLSYSYIEHVSRKLLTFISTCSKEKANSSARIFYYHLNVVATEESVYAQAQLWTEGILLLEGAGGLTKLGCLCRVQWPLADELNCDMGEPGSRHLCAHFVWYCWQPRAAIAGTLELLFSSTS